MVTASISEGVVRLKGLEHGGVTRCIPMVRYLVQQEINGEARCQNPHKLSGSFYVCITKAQCISLMALV